jgi:hypothetical protein
MDSTVTCSGHGQCISMTERGKLELARNPFNMTGKKEVDPWLVNRFGNNILTCECEEGFSGWDCSQRKSYCSRIPK